MGLLRWDQPGGGACMGPEGGAVADEEEEDWSDEGAAEVGRAGGEDTPGMLGRGGSPGRGGPAPGPGPCGTGAPGGRGYDWPDAAALRNDGGARFLILTPASALKAAEFAAVKRIRSSSSDFALRSFSFLSLSRAASFLPPPFGFSALAPGVPSAFSSLRRRAFSSRSFRSFSSRSRASIIRSLRFTSLVVTCGMESLELSTLIFEACINLSNKVRNRSCTA
mmetsp:Transcript_2222/g.3372  ORF Transcript_2222/g.3372 Transcript_2222/m.3372 type:complete len:222 (-) Transcript_2222:3692-4357(-)